MNGIVIGTDILPDTDRVRVDDSAWWTAGERGTRPRKGHRVERLVGHWTAGRPLTGDGAGPLVVRRMKARKRSDGSPLEVGVHFVISWDGVIWQTADLAQATVHVGHRKTILTSIGVECCWPGTMTQASRLGMVEARPVMGAARGGTVKACAPSPELLSAWHWLAHVLATASHPLLAIPRRRGSTSRHGAMEHCDCPGTKIDAAGLLVGALGWP